MENIPPIWYNLLLKNPPRLVKEEFPMTKKGKIVLAVSLSATIFAVGSAAAAVMICKKIYEKNYFSAD